MKALFFDQKLNYIDDYPQPERAAGEALIAVSVVGVCATDLEIINGYMGFKGVLGHEFVGRVVESEQKDLIGKRVVGDINCPCNNCELCRRGLRKHCPTRTVLGISDRDGALGEYLTLPNENLYCVPDQVSDAEAVFAEPLAAACQAFEQTGLKKGEKATVLGDGKLGLLVAKVFAANGEEVTLVGKHRDKIGLVKREGINTRMLSELTEEREADVVIDATAHPSGLETALKIVRPAGRIILKTTVAEPYRIDMAPVVINELSLIGSRCGPLDKALELLSAKKIDLLPMITAEYPIERGLEAFEKAMDKNSLKVLVKIVR